MRPSWVLKLDLRGCDEGEGLLEEVEMGFGVCGGGVFALSGEEKGGFPLRGLNLG